MVIDLSSFPSKKLKIRSEIGDNRTDTYLKEEDMFSRKFLFTVFFIQVLGLTNTYAMDLETCKNELSNLLSQVANQNHEDLKAIGNIAQIYLTSSHQNAKTCQAELKVVQRDLKAYNQRQASKISAISTRISDLNKANNNANCDLKPNNRMKKSCESSVKRREKEIIELQSQVTKVDPIIEIDQVGSSNIITANNQLEPAQDVQTFNTYQDSLDSIEGKGPLSVEALEQEALNEQQARQDQGTLLFDAQQIYADTISSSTEKSDKINELLTKREIQLKKECNGGTVCLNQVPAKLAAEKSKLDEVAKQQGIFFTQHSPSIIDDETQEMSQAGRDIAQVQDQPEQITQQQQAQDIPGTAGNGLGEPTDEASDFTVQSPEPAFSVTNGQDDSGFEETYQDGDGNPITKEQFDQLRAADQAAQEKLAAEQAAADKRAADQAAAEKLAAEKRAADQAAQEKAAAEGREDQAEAGEMTTAVNKCQDYPTQVTLPINYTNICSFLGTKCGECSVENDKVYLSPVNTKLSASFKLSTTEAKERTNVHLIPTREEGEYNGRTLVNFMEAQKSKYALSGIQLEEADKALNNIAGYKIVKVYKKAFNAIDDIESHTLPFRGGTTIFNQCQKALKASSDSKWGDEIYKDSKLRSQAWELIAMSKVYEKMVDICEKKKNIDREDVGSICFGELIREQETHGNVLAKTYQEGVNEAGLCEAYASILKDNIDEDFHKDSDYVTGQGESKSFDGRIKCEARSLEVMDYDECKLMVNAYNTSVIAKKGLEVTQTVRTQEQSFEAQQKAQLASQQQMYGTTTDGEETEVKSAQLIAYELQRDSIKKQASLAQERTALSTSSAAAITGLAANMPELDNIENLCKKNGGERSSQVMGEVKSGLKRTLNKFVSVTGGSIDVKTRDHAGSCHDLTHNKVNDFIPNKEQTANAYAIAAEAGVDAAQALVEAKAFRRQAKLIDDMINKVNNIDTAALAEGMAYNNDLIKYCEANPNDAQCLGLGNGTASNVFSTGDMTYSTDGLSGNSLDANSADGSSSATGDDTGIGESVSESGIPTSKKRTTSKNSGKAGDIVAAAKRTKNNAQNNGAGGSGGGVSPSASGTGSANNPTGQEGGDSLTAGSDKYNSKYKGGSGGANYLARGGSGLRDGNSKKVDNPFSKMFKNKGNQVLKFRNPASIGSKSGNLFTRISNRYDAVDSKNRLYKYSLEAKK